MLGVRGWLGVRGYGLPFAAAYTSAEEITAGNGWLGLALGVELGQGGGLGIRLGLGLG